MLSRELNKYLEDILKEIKLLTSIAKDASLSIEIKNHVSERAIEIISKSISITGREYKIDWEDFKFLVDIRNDIVHEYFDNSFELVKEVILGKLPLLKKMVQKLIK